jgi:hypothetical protein
LDRKAALALPMARDNSISQGRRLGLTRALALNKASFILDMLCGPNSNLLGAPSQTALSAAVDPMLCDAKLSRMLNKAKWTRSTLGLGSKAMLRDFIVFKKIG